LGFEAILLKASSAYALSCGHLRRNFTWLCPPKPWLRQLWFQARKQS